MTTAQTVTGTKPDASIDETVQIMDEMERLLKEMKETMSLIKRIVGDDALANTTSDSSFEDIIQGS